MFIFLLTSNYLRELQLDTEPIGWDGLRYRFQRDEKYHGVMLEMSAELTFIKRAGAYLREMYRLFGPEALVNLSVYEVDPNEFRPVRVYRGRVDFTTYIDAERGVTANLKETTFATNLLNRNDQPIDLLSGQSLSGAAIPSLGMATVSMHSQEIILKYAARQDATATESLQLSSATSSSDFGASALLRIGFPATNPPLNEFPVPEGYGLFIGGLNDSINTPFYRAKESGTFTIELAFTHTIRALFAINDFQLDIVYQYRLKRADGTITTTDLVPQFGQNIPSAGFFTRTTTVRRTVITETLEIGDELYFYAEFRFHEISALTYDIGIESEYSAGSYLKMRAIATTPATTATGPLVHEALDYCCAAMTDQPRPLYSDYFGRPGLRQQYLQDGPGALRLVTSGFAIRGFPFTTSSAPAAGEVDTRKTITTTFNDLYDSLNAIDCLGLGIEQVNGKQQVRIEPRAFFYQDKEVLRLGSVTGLSKAVRTDALHNAAEFGYQHWQSGTQNGLDEFNGRRTYTLPLTAVKNTYSAISTLNAAGYLIERTRRDRYSDGATKEGQADAENFVICLRRLGGTAESYESERDQAYRSVTGILSPSTTYNLRISPGRMLQKHQPWLHTGLLQQGSKRVILTKIEGSAGLQSRFYEESAPLDESAAIQVSDLAPAIVAEFTYEFTARLRRWQMEALRTNPYGRISFLDSKGQRHSGYLLAAERQPVGGLTTFTLLPVAA